MTDIFGVAELKVDLGRSGPLAPLAFLIRMFILD